MIIRVVLGFMFKDAGGVVRLVCQEVGEGGAIFRSFCTVV